MKLHRAVSRSPRIEMVPLLDTFFLLLAFFISSVLTLERVRGLPVELPRAAGARLPKDDRLLVTVGAAGAIQLEAEPVTLEVLRLRLAGGGRGGAAPRVGLRADRATPYEWLVQVLAAIREAGVSQVSLLTEPGSEGAGAKGE